LPPNCFIPPVIAMTYSRAPGARGDVRGHSCTTLHAIVNSAMRVLAAMSTSLPLLSYGASIQYITCAMMIKVS
jgi:hypothetical protein